LYIDIINSSIEISDFNNLKKYHISQFKYFGFLNGDDGVYRLNSLNIGYDLKKLISYIEEENINFTLSESVSDLILKLTKDQIDLEETFKYAKLFKDGTSINESYYQFEAFTRTLPRKLKTHQLKSAYHFYCVKNGANFSVPGSGKTSTLLSVYAKLKLEEKCNLLFIVGPPSCFQPWINEFKETLGRVPTSSILSGGNKSFRKSEYFRSFGNISELYLSTFHTVLNDYREIVTFFSQKGIKPFLIIDEAHYMKQIGGSWATSLLKIGQYAQYKGILTGTPIPKSYKDLFNLFDFLWGDNNPISEEDKIQISIWEKNKKFEDIKNVLEDRIGPCFYRVRKKDLGLTPPIFHEPIIVKMKDDERSIYEAIKAKIFELDQSDYFRDEHILTKLWRGRMIRLRQSISHPKLLLSAIDNYSEKYIDNSDLESKIRNYEKNELSGKLEALTDIVLSLRQQDQKVLIWSNFVGTLKLIKKHFNNLGERAELIYGKTPIRKDDQLQISEEKTREDIRDEFLDIKSGLDILIANPAACAESISLHKSCFHAIYYDLSYNAAQYLQSLDRIHRVGGSEFNTANYYFLQYENSVDQDIKKNLEIKAQKMYDLIDKDYEIYDLDLFEEDEDDIELYKKVFKNNG